MNRRLAEVLPQAAHALGVNPLSDPWLHSARSVVVLLVDGLGLLNLEEAAVDGGLVAEILAQPAGETSLPSTTPVALATLGTGLDVGQHGFIGATFPLPEFDVLLQPLSWRNGPDPVAVQPESTWFERIAAAGIAVTRIGPAAYAESGLTRAVLRGGEHLPAENLAELVPAAVAAAESGGLVYAYYPTLDKLGHMHGVASDEWRNELMLVLAAIAELRAKLPSGSELLLTADHGMLDVEHRVWIEDRPGLLRNMDAIAGEPRLRHVYAKPGASALLRRDWEAIEDIADVFTREEFIASGALGAVDDFAAERIGDLVVVARERNVVASRKFDSRVSSLKGLHGATTPTECLIPIARLAI